MGRGAGRCQNCQKYCPTLGKPDLPLDISVKNCGNAGENNPFVTPLTNIPRKLREVYCSSLTQVECILCFQILNYYYNYCSFQQNVQHQQFILLNYLLYFYLLIPRLIYTQNRLPVSNQHISIKLLILKRPSSFFNILT